MAELTEPGYWDLELGDVIHVGDDGVGVTKGSVVEVDNKLLILWEFGGWEWGNDFLGTAEEEGLGLPFRIERREWDLDIESIHDAVYEGTDLEANVA